jgi:hypothetical protein
LYRRQLDCQLRGQPTAPTPGTLRGARADGQGGALPPHAAEDADKAVIVIAAILQGINLEFA